MKYIVILLIVVLFFSGCTGTGTVTPAETQTDVVSTTATGPQYLLWSVESSEYMSQIDLEDFPFEYTFEYPQGFIEYPLAMDSDSPQFVFLIKDFSQYFDPSSTLQELDHYKIKEGMEQEYEREVNAWYQARFEVCVLQGIDIELIPDAYYEITISSDNGISEIVEQRSVSVDGKDAVRKTTSYYVDWTIPGIENRRVLIETKFEYQGYSWLIVADAPWGGKDIMTNYYNHLLETFHIIE